jgi:hypothetical protein
LLNSRTLNISLSKCQMVQGNERESASPERMETVLFSGMCGESRLLDAKFLCEAGPSAEEIRTLKEREADLSLRGRRAP